MDKVMGRVDVKDTKQHPVSGCNGWDKAKNSDKQEHDAEKDRGSFNHFLTSCWLKSLCLWQSGQTLASQNNHELFTTPTTRQGSKINTMKRLLVFVLFFAVTGAFSADPGRGQDLPSQTTKTAVFAGGCFWCVQPAFDKAKGVVKTVVGYSGGTEPNPTYELVSSEKTRYRESIEITYDPTKISYDQLLDIYWRQIDPTQADGQFTDIGPSYRAAIFYNNDDEKKNAEASREKLARSGKFSRPIVTEILPAMKFYPAEAYHQKYYQQNPEHFEAFEKGSGRVSFEKKTWSGKQ
jgi:peptide-methionine (S)-S-oxide reductase